MQLRLSLCFLLLTSAINASAQSLTFTRTDHTTPYGARGIAAADFNRDGTTDVALANAATDSVAVLLNFSTQPGKGFSPTYDIALGGGPFDITTADLNNDGLADIIVANADANSIDILLGHAQGGFRGRIQVGAMGNPRGVTVADMDWDGNADIIYTQYNFNSVQVLYGDGSGWNFVAYGGGATTGARPQGVAVADFNRDGRRDIAVANTGANALAIMYQTDSGTFQRVNVPGWDQLNALSVADFNRDGWTDVAAISTARNILTVNYNSRSGFTGIYTAYRTGTSPRGIDAADVNADGWLDIAVASRAGSFVEVYVARPGAPGEFELGMASVSGNGSRDVVLADFNNDGQMDIATGNEYANSMTVFTNISRPPSDTFWEAHALPSDAWSAWLHLADFNKNGQVDVLYYGGIILDGTTNVSVRSPTPNLNIIMGGAAGDFNTDGNLDVVLAARYCTPNCRIALEVFHGDGAGAFQYMESLGPLTGWHYWIKTVDVTSDGRVDLLALGPRELLVFENAGGRLVQKPPLALSNDMWQFDVGDLNRDGKLDLAMVVQSPDAVQVLHGDGSGQFTPAGQFAAATERRTLRIADVNNDGRADIVSGGPRFIAVWLGDADGSLASALYSAERADGEAMVLGDFTADGRIDALIGFSGLARGNGDGTFEEPEAMNLIWHAGEAVDYDRDGRLDAVVAGPHIFALLARDARGPNRPPVAVSGAPFTWEYWRQFADEERGISARRSWDPNLDVLTFEWRNASGRIIGTQEWLSLPILEPGTHRYTLIVRDGHGGEDSEAVTITVKPHKESVTHVFDYADPHGAWVTTDDATAANGVGVWHPNANAAKVSTPLASPVNFVDVWVFADATHQYKLWLRLKAENNSWGNDSVFVQFAQGVIVGGRTRYEEGTADALDINLEQCSGCGLSGWGWRDERWGPNLTAAPALLKFPSGGWHRVRIQTREDGVSFDQIVLSAERYLTNPPGPAKNDATLLPNHPWWW